MIIFKIEWLIKIFMNNLNKTRRKYYLIIIKLNIKKQNFFNVEWLYILIDIIIASNKKTKNYNL